MIRVSKSAVVPEKLRSDSQRETQVLCTAFAAGEALKFKASVYAAPEVKAQLLHDQHNKCCFCESTSIESADVEHFRPKGGVAEEPTHPGYYWLAYDWDNLFACCTTCNSRSKKTQFPLEASGVRAFAPTDSLAAEYPIFVHPVLDDPEAHIRFNSWDAEPITLRGRETILSLGLNRRELILRRRERWEMIKALESIVRDETIPEPKRVAAKALLDRWRSVSGEFSSMARSV